MVGGGCEGVGGDFVKMLIDEYVGAFQAQGYKRSGVHLIPYRILCRMTFMGVSAIGSCEPLRHGSNSIPLSKYEIV